MGDDREYFVTLKLTVHSGGECHTLGTLIDDIRWGNPNISEEMLYSALEAIGYNVWYTEREE